MPFPDRFGRGAEDSLVAPPDGAISLGLLYDVPYRRGRARFASVAGAGGGVSAAG